MAEQNKEQDKVSEQEQEQEQEQDYLVGVRGPVGRNYGKNNISDRLYLFWVSCHPILDTRISGLCPSVCHAQGTPPGF